MVGAYFYEEDLKNDSAVIFGPTWRTYADILVFGLTGGTAELSDLAAIGVPSPAIFATGQGSTGYFTQETETTTFFGQVDINLTDKLSAILGASYIEDKKVVTGRNVNTDIFSQIGFVGVGTTLLLSLIHI